MSAAAADAGELAHRQRQRQQTPTDKRQQNAAPLIAPQAAPSRRRRRRRGASSKRQTKLNRARREHDQRALAGSAGELKGLRPIIEIEAGQEAGEREPWQLRRRLCAQGFPDQQCREG